MKKKALAILFILLLSFNTFCFAQSGVSYENKLELLRYIYFAAKSDAKENISDTDLFLDTLMKMVGDDDEAYDNLLKNYTGSIDEYGYYFTNDEWQALNAELTGVTGGIGITIEPKNTRLTVVGVMPDSPAEKAGVMPGYILLKVSDTDLTQLTFEQALNLVRGEPGTPVEVTFEISDGNTAVLRMIRSEIQLPSVDYAVIGDNENIGYIKISTIANTTGEELSKALSSFKEKNIGKIILDLRYNGGGTLLGGLEVSDAFLEKGQTIVSIEPKNPDEAEIFTAGGQEYSGDMVVLVNEYTASAAEIITGALKDNKRATVIGNTTYGKGTVQNVVNLPLYGGAFKFTTAYYMTPNGESINKVGIFPNLTVDNKKYRLEIDQIPEFFFERKMKLGDIGEDVANLKKSLRILNYRVAEDDIFDEDTQSAVANFQAKSQLYAYGICDLTTQQHLKNALLETDFYEDTQLDKAIEYIN